jgi:hypothetical protein
MKETSKKTGKKHDFGKNKKQYPDFQSSLKELGMSSDYTAFSD